jgi:hypothetical protein
MANVHSVQYHNCNILIPPITVTLNCSRFYTTLGRNPLDEWSVHCRYFYMTTQHSKGTSMPPKEFASGFRASECPQRDALPRGHCDRPYYYPTYEKFCSAVKDSVFRKTQDLSRLRSWVRIPRGAWLFVCCECRVLSGRGLCDELITRLEESYRMWCVVVCDLKTLKIGAPYIYIYIYMYMTLVA